MGASQAQPSFARNVLDDTMTLVTGQVKTADHPTFFWELCSVSYKTRIRRKAMELRNAPTCRSKKFFNSTVAFVDRSPWSKSGGWSTDDEEAESDPVLWSSEPSGSDSICSSGSGASVDNHARREDHAAVVVVERS